MQQNLTYNKNSNYVRNLVYAALLLALTFLATRFLSWPGPIPPGYINLGDAVILFAAAYLGPGYAFAVGSIGSALADISYAAWLYVPATFVIKGFEALIANLLMKKINKYAATVIAVVFMAVGYFVYEAFILVYFDKTFGWTAAATNLGPNLVQAGANAVIYLSISLLTKKFARLN